MVWDYFISHASDDKALVAAPLAHYFRSVAFEVWYDDFSLAVGDSIMAGINHGLADSRFGIVILSPAFFANAWPQRELAALVATTAGSERRVLPVWHQVGASEVARASPLLADLKAVSTSSGLNAVAEQLVRASFPDRLQSLPVSNAANETGEDRAEAHKLLEGLLKSDPPREDILLVLSAYQSLLGDLVGYYPLVIPATATQQAVPFDFAIIEPHGVTGPIVLTLVVLGPVTSGQSAREWISHLKGAYGPETTFTDRPYNDYIRTRYAGEFPFVYDLAQGLASLVECDNVHFARPEVWNVSLLVLCGRRTTDPIALADRAAQVSSAALSMEIASYDRLVDGRRIGRI